MKKRPITLCIDNQTITCDVGTTILQACESLGIYVPSLCYHPYLPIQNRCNLCHVEVTGASQLMNACSTPVAQGMEVTTRSPWLAENHKRSLEPLVQKHPYDCPICPKNGDCVVQELTVTYTPSLPSFRRAVFPTKGLVQGPLIQPTLDRCIQCMRCVNYAASCSGSIPGDDELSQIVGALNQLTTHTVLSGNVIDVCPAGALNPIPQGAKYSTWEMTEHRGIDVTNAEGAAIVLQHVDAHIVGVRAGVNAAINECWITDKARFSFDGLMTTRIDQPYVRRQGNLVPVSWSDAFKQIVRHMSALDGVEMAALSGDLVEVESVYLLRQLLDALHIPHRDCRTDKAFLPTLHRSDYLFNTTFDGVERADVCLLVGCDPAYDAPLLHQRLGRRVRAGELVVGSIGSAQGFDTISETGEGLRALLQKDHPFAKKLRGAKRPMLMIGASLLQGSDGALFYRLSQELGALYRMVTPEWNGFNIVHTAAGRVGALDVGFVPAPGGADTIDILKNARIGKIKLIYLLGVDNILPQEFGSSLVIYQGSHWDQGAARADIVLPGATFVEKNGFYVNMEGRAQRQFKLKDPPGIAKEDWKIIRALSEVLGHKLPYNVHDAIVEDLKRRYPQFNQVGHIIPAHVTPYEGEKVDRNAPILNHRIASRVPSSYYRTDPIACASENMKRCVAFAQKNEPSRRRE